MAIVAHSEPLLLKKQIRIGNNFLDVADIELVRKSGGLQIRQKSSATTVTTAKLLLKPSPAFVKPPEPPDI